MSTPAEKLVPHNVEAEMGTLGSILMDPDALATAAGMLRPDDWYVEAHRLIYEAALDLYEASRPADLITLTDELARRGILDDVGGVAFVSWLANQVPTSANVEHYARIVARTATARRLIHAAGQIAAVAYNDPDSERVQSTHHVVDVVRIPCSRIRKSKHSRRRRASSATCSSRIRSPISSATPTPGKRLSRSPGRSRLRRAHPGSAAPCTRTRRST